MPRILALTILVVSGQVAVAVDDPIRFESAPQAVFAAKCVKCHGEDQLSRKAELNLQSIAGIRRGGESGPVIQPGTPGDSLLWTHIADGLMPPAGEPPLMDEERDVIREWIAQGAQSSAPEAEDSVIPAAARAFWSFQALHRVAPPQVRQSSGAATPIDRFLTAELERHGLSGSPPADRPTLIRRLYLDLLGLPPHPDDAAAFEADSSLDAYAQLVDRLLASPQYGERWGRHWLDVVGYSDSNGYHRADTPRPLAYRYRDYVVDAWNADKPYDRLWMEQLAGDELFRPEERDPRRADVTEALIATHFLRNGPDGTDSTEGNEMVQTIERYAVLEQQLQIMVTAMFGLTIDCARCHSHKFDPIPQTDYYALQSLLYPAFNVREWVPPAKRTLQLATPEQRARFDAEMQRVDAAVRDARGALGRWVREHRPVGSCLLADGFDGHTALADRWSNTAPGDDRPGGTTGVQVDSNEAPAARCVGGGLQIVQTGGGSDGWLSTRTSFDWTPDERGGVIQATFDLVADRLTPEAAGAERIGFYLAMRDYDDSISETGGNILCDGNPDGGASISVDYPGADARGLGTIGKSGFKPGRNYGVRITNVGEDQYRLELLVDWLAEEGAVVLSGAQLPDGGFGFEYCCGRSFVVDNVSIEEFGSESSQGEGGGGALAAFGEQSKAMAAETEAQVQALESQRPAKPGEIAWVTDLSAAPPDVHVLKRGRYFDLGPVVEPAGLTVLSDAKHQLSVPEAAAAGTTGRRRAFAEWATRPDSRAAALLARVQVNRLWMWHFGRGLVDPPDNFGAQGTPPSHPELLEWLAGEFVDSGWSTKHIQRLILLSSAYQQSTQPSAEALAVDPADRLLWGYPARRLESEAIRDSFLAAAGMLDDALGGPPVDYRALPSGQVLLSEEDPAAGDGLSRRTLYHRHRRSEPATLLQIFDQPAVEPNCLRRSTSAVVSQALAMLNGGFAVRMSQKLANRVRAEAGPDRAAQVERAFRLALSRAPTPTEAEQALAFLDAQRQSGGDGCERETDRALADFCQVLLASSEFLYLQ